VVLISEVNKGQFYYTSFGPVVLLIDTSWVSLDETTTKVSTRYSVGTPRFLKLLQPLVHKILARNYEILMSEDTPMRLQRGKLRKRGYSFRQDKEGHSYSDSIQVSKNNLKSPELSESQIKVNLVNVNEMPNEYWDESGTRSVVVHRLAGELFIGPAICPHEGASLDGANCRNNSLECPWHGRLIKPWASVNLKNGDSLIGDESEVSFVAVEKNHLLIHLPTKSST
jgi:nitrite reductase/ring-hydroxylating ferredoxin subunit